MSKGNFDFSPPPYDAVITSLAIYMAMEPSGPHCAIRLLTLYDHSYTFSIGFVYNLA